MVQQSVDHEAELEAFRIRCRAFLVEHAVGGADIGPDDPRGDKALAAAQAFQRALFDAGLAGLSVPVEHGGQGLTEHHDRVFREEAGQFPLMTEQLSISIGNCFPAVARFGAEAQRHHLPRILRADEVVCQLYSEPGAGSDLAAVSTRAVRDGDGWVVNGQKVWTTLAHKAHLGVLLARTNPDVPKHQGLTMFLVDMHAPGIEVRPIHQMDGALHFDEVFFTDVHVGADAVLGEVDGGWHVATTMMGYQRVARGTGMTGGVQHPRFDRLAAEARHRGRLADPVLRADLVRLLTYEVCHSVLAVRTRAELEAGRPPGPAGSLGKLALVRASRLFGDLVWRVVGLDAAAPTDPEGEEAAFAKDSLYTLSLSISGGTSEIQHNIIGERVLGLPKEPSGPAAPR